MAAKTPQEFRKMLRRALFLDQRESALFDKIPDVILDGIFKHNFNGNLALAERVLFNRYREVERVDRARLEQEKQNIFGAERVTGLVSAALNSNTPILFVTDNDNDGSLAQAILIEFLKALPIEKRRLVHIEYAQPIGQVRGITKEVVDLAFAHRNWAADHEALIITADNGINNSNEVDRILGTYSRASVIITDHHMPDPELVVKENAHTAIFNPKYNPTAYFKKKNISGANTLGVLLKNVANEVSAMNPVSAIGAGEFNTALANIDEIGSWANLLDYANADIADMPVRPYTINKALELRPLLNVSNSMSNLVSGNFDAGDIEEIAAASQGSLGANSGLSAEWITEKVEKVRALNVIAHKLLNIFHSYGASEYTYSEKEFYSMFAKELSSDLDSYQSINPNFIEQLRPAIFNLAAIDNKDVFLASIFDNMVNVFEDLRGVEQEILAGLRDVGLLRADVRPNSTILYPIDPSITRVFNRRLLGKAYNQENAGFLLTLSDVGASGASGSMRSMYEISKILEDKSEIEDQLGINVEFLGHEMAAGFFIRTTDGKPMDEQRLSDFNRWMDDRVSELKLADRINQLPTLEVDFASAGLLKKVNSAIKANLAGMWGLPTMIKFAPNKGDALWITDTKTTEQISLEEVVTRKRFGYQAIKTDFHDGALVVPVELLRSIVESGYTKALRLSYMDDGVFMGNQVVEADMLPVVVNLKGGRRDQEVLARYYETEFKDSHFIPLTREDFRSSPYFRFNRYGDSEFELWESVVIGILDKVGADVLAVIDTEGTGLGKAPKCFNFGGTHIKVAAGSGVAVEEEDFESRFFRNQEGREFLLSQEQMALVTPLSGEAPARGVVLYRNSIERGVAYAERVVFPGALADLERVTNLKAGDGAVVYNRKVDGFACSFLINNGDFAITKEFEELTGIGNWMVEKHGKPAATVDRQLVQHYDTLKNANGEPAKIIFQAHNMPYDRGVISANFQHFNRLVGEHLTSDTAKLARSAKLAYDDTPVSSIEGVTGIPAKAYFYDSPYSNYSLSSFLSRIPNKKGGVFPDITAKLLLRYNPESERFSVIDRVENREILLDVSLEDIIARKSQGPLPNNAVKYSVERLSSRAMIRNILLFDTPAPQIVDLQPAEAPYREALELFQRNYHFDSTLERNIENFLASLWQNEQSTDWLGEVDLVDVGHRFLHKNRDIQAKFHDGWMYEKVLAHYEPDSKTLRVPAEIVEQVNYYTDVPSSKIRAVFDNVVRFKRHFGIEHALVHEQHNNIRQRSPDGQGLSDTAYECVLPQHLGMMKFYNPYHQSTRRAVDHMVEQNIKGSMVQTMVGEDFNNEMAMDSYSIAQMTAFRRQGKTDLIQRAQSLAKQGEVKDGERAAIKFKLGSSVLPPGSAVYAKPIGHVDMVQIKKDSEMMAFILVNEQMKTAIASAKMPATDKENMVQLAYANDPLATRYRDELLTRYEHVEYSRKELQTKKLLELVRETFDGVAPKIPRSLDISPEMISMAEEMTASFLDICNFTGTPAPVDTVDELLEKLRGELARKEEAFQSGDSEVAEVEFDPDSVRQKNFLPELEIERRDPIKFVLKHYGMEFCFPYVKEINKDAGLISIPLAKGKRSRGP